MVLFRTILEEGVDTAYYEPRSYEVVDPTYRESLFVDYTAAAGGGDPKKLMWKK